MYSAINKLLSNGNVTEKVEFETCGQLPSQACTVTGTSDNTLPVSSETKHIPERQISTAEKLLVFEATLPPLGIVTYFVEKQEELITDGDDDDDDDDDIDLLEEEIIELAEEAFGPAPYEDAIEMIENQYYTITVNRGTGLISRLWNKQEDIAISLDQNFYYYVGHEGYNYDGDSQASGAYIFRPTSNTPKRANLGASVSIISYKGGLVQEIRQIFCPWISQVIRLYKDKNYVELEWTVGPIPSGRGYEGREVITKYITDLDTHGVFYTDLNGRETMKRQRDTRDTWTLNQTEPVAGNYYPITSRAFIREERRGIQFTVLVDRSEGSASIHDGELEIMLHRRTFHDDSLGVEEPLTEYGASGRGIVARGKHYIMLNKVSTAATVYRPLYQEIYLQPTILFSKQYYNNDDWSDIFISQWSGIKTSLPENIHLLTLDLWPNPPVETKYTALLLRLEHIYEKYEDRRQSSPARVYLTVAIAAAAAAAAVVVVDAAVVVVVVDASAAVVIVDAAAVVFIVDDAAAVVVVVDSVAVAAVVAAAAVVVDDAAVVGVVVTAAVVVDATAVAVVVVVAADAAVVDAVAVVVAADAAVVVVVVAAAAAAAAAVVVVDAAAVAVVVVVAAAAVVIDNLFEPFTIVDVIELTLGANLKKADLQRFQWNTDGRGGLYTNVNEETVGTDLVIEMSAMQIKTFQVNIKH
ncbi:Mannosidase alpha class 2B member 1 [Mactra antiquata]